MINISNQEFEELVNDSLDKLDKKFLDALENIAIVIEEHPSQHQMDKVNFKRGLLFGLYEGVPLPSRGGRPTLMPDKISIFRHPILIASANKHHLQSIVLNTVWHEIAHYFGLNHDRIHELELKSKTKKQFSENVEYLTANNLDSLGVKHAWFTRSGGVSSAPFDSLNVGSRVGDRPEYADENIRRALFSLDLRRDRFVFAGPLAHSNEVFIAGVEDAGKTLSGYDAVITDVKDLPIGVSTADCYVLFLYDPKNSAIGLAHIGWRGVLANVAGATIESMTKAFGTNSKDLVCAIGPGASVKNYEVQEDVASKFSDQFIHRKNDKLFLDVLDATKDQLNKSGVQQIESLNIDTIEDERFFSYRRDNKITGRFLSIITL